MIRIERRALQVCRSPPRFALSRRDGDVRALESTERWRPRHRIEEGHREILEPNVAQVHARGAERLGARGLQTVDSARLARASGIDLTARG